MLKPGQEILFTRQRHEATKMGLHWDYRMVVGDKAYSWATKKEMPGPGTSIVLFEQPVHDREYALSPRVEIPSGSYGAGVTTLDWVRKAKIGEHSTPDQLTIYVGKEKFLLKKLPKTNVYGEKGWLFKNLSGTDLNHEKKSEMSVNKYLEKIAELQTHYVYHNSENDIDLLNRRYIIRHANNLLSERGYKPSLHETAPDEAKANNLLNAKYKTGTRPENLKGNALGILGGGALGAGVGFGLATAKVNPALAAVAGLGTAVGSGLLAKKTYYTDEKRKLDDEHQATNNVYLQKLLSRYEREDE